MEGITEFGTKKPDAEGENIEDEYDEDNDEFYFESDHLALRGNADYRSVLRTIVILEAQQTEATKHIDLITECEKEALNDPEAFLERLKSRDSLDLPGRINIQIVCFSVFVECSFRFSQEKRLIDSNLSATFSYPKSNSKSIMSRCHRLSRKMKVETAVRRMPPLVTI